MNAAVSWVNTHKLVTLSFLLLHAVVFCGFYAWSMCLQASWISLLFNKGFCPVPAPHQLFLIRITARLTSGWRLTSLAGAGTILTVISWLYSHFVIAVTVWIVW